MTPIPQVELEAKLNELVQMSGSVQEIAIWLAHFVEARLSVQENDKIRRLELKRNRIHKWLMEIQECNYTCEAGELQNNVTWIKIVTEIERE